MQVTGFAPITSPTTKVVVLGSMPGVPSLRDNQYYANPRNQFWHVIAQLSGWAQWPDYDQRCQWLQDHGISVWDVLAGGERQGSLDSAIVRTTEQANPLAEWLAPMPQLQAVLLNGGKAWQGYQKYVVKAAGHPPGVAQEKLPSTSPAYAAMKPKDKQAAWIAALNRYL